jgi:hypothetical protein
MTDEAKRSEEGKKPFRLAPLPMERPKREQRATIFDSLASGNLSTSSLASPALACAATGVLFWGFYGFIHAITNLIIAFSAIGLAFGVFGYRSTRESDGGLRGFRAAFVGIVWSSVLLALGVFLRLYY